MLSLHSFTLVTFLWHLLFDGIGDAGGYWASKFCRHAYHRIPLAMACGLISTLLMVTLVG